jgi:hypothetical protein
MAVRSILSSRLHESKPQQHVRGRISRYTLFRRSRVSIRLGVLAIGGFSLRVFPLIRSVVIPILCTQSRSDGHRVPVLPHPLLPKTPYRVQFTITLPGHVPCNPGFERSRDPAPLTNSSQGSVRPSTRVDPGCFASSRSGRRTYNVGYTSE